MLRGAGWLAAAGLMAGFAFAVPAMASYAYFAEPTPPLAAVPKAATAPAHANPWVSKMPAQSRQSANPQGNAFASPSPQDDTTAAPKGLDLEWALLPADPSGSDMSNVTAKAALSREDPWRPNFFWTPGIGARAMSFDRSDPWDPSHSYPVAARQQVALDRSDVFQRPMP